MTQQWEQGRAREGRLLNVIFPVWLLVLLPPVWIVVVPANILIDLLVLLLGLWVLKVSGKWRIAGKSLLLVVIFGFLSDFVGAALLYATLLVPYDYDSDFGVWWSDQVATPVAMNPFTSIWGFLWVAVAVFVSAVLIYQLNSRLSFRRTPLQQPQQKKLALTLAILTAPYLFFVPAEWLMF